MDEKEMNPVDNNDKHVNGAQSQLNGQTPPMRPVSAFDAFRTDQSFGGPAEASSEFSVLIGFPREDRYCRFRPEESYRATVWTYKADRQAPLYLVSSHMLKEFRSRAKKVLLAAWVDTAGQSGLLDITLSSGKFGGNDWTESKITLVEAGIKRWVRIEKNEAETAWKACYPDADLGEPEFPEDKTMDDYLTGAFGDRLIVDDQHLIVRRLRGQVKY
jgi:hypothetical protein